jgi:hypothetical protein
MSAARLFARWSSPASASTYRSPWAAKVRSISGAGEGRRLHHKASRSAGVDGDGGTSPAAVSPSGVGALEIFELAAAFEAVAGRDLDLLRQFALRVGDIAADVAVVHVNIDVIDQLRVLGADHRRPLRRLHGRYLAERALRGHPCLEPAPAWRSPADWISTARRHQTASINDRPG